MCRIKRSVQAQYNTEVSFLAAQALAGRKGTADVDASKAASDPMAAAEMDAAKGKGPAFVVAKNNTNVKQSEENDDEDTPAQANEDEIQIDDDDL